MPFDEVTLDYMKYIPVSASSWDLFTSRGWQVAFSYEDLDFDSETIDYACYSVNREVMNSKRITGIGLSVNYLEF